VDREVGKVWDVVPIGRVGGGLRGPGGEADLGPRRSSFGIVTLA
jgi:hypothetical protein